MSIKPSGLWCDLCGIPILDGAYWDIWIDGVKGYHSCAKCRKIYDKNHPAAEDETEP